MSHDPSSRLFLPLTISDAFGFGVIGTWLTSPWWFDTLKSVSAVAALLVPIVSVAVGIAVVIEKRQVMQMRARAQARGSAEDEDIP